VVLEDSLVFCAPSIIAIELVVTGTAIGEDVQTIEWKASKCNQSYLCTGSEVSDIGRKVREMQQLY
jgi:hypothetical protein